MYADILGVYDELSVIISDAKTVQSLLLRLMTEIAETGTTNPKTVNELMPFLME